jgi:hypothetical protein
MTVLNAIEWDAPWFQAVAERGRALALRADPLRALNAAAAQARLSNARGLPIRFVAADAADASPYESHIASTGEVPTRGNRHDLLNALVWLAYPRIKAGLNALQASAIVADGVGARRGALRDAATLLDENGVLLVSQRADLIDALRRHDWHGLFVRHRLAWHSDIRVIVFGHALMEKLVVPYKAICAHALHVSFDRGASPGAIDDAVAASLGANLAPKQLLPLPVLGIPGWSDNDDPAYYSDLQVFRPLREARGGAHRQPASTA